ncbi:hypothetical protein TELCIR_19672 [Teladorsagia circumcincta]|uniref:RRM domain-containing protein n=1 Tax=Teladorsagia circumcincta TaxID=45464 RepID=A0A2G9TNG2_TELCI|nr:hypothetical protein TELCIR_19672 [Teladorsagia circumcincta]
MSEIQSCDDCVIRLCVHGMEPSKASTTRFATCREHGNSHDQTVEFSVALPPSTAQDKTNEPAATEAATAAPTPAPSAPAPAPVAGAPAPAPSVHAEVLVAMPVLQQHGDQQKQAMYAQALSLMARVYIGSISFEVREEMIKKAFEVYGPIKSINMSWDPTTGHHKGFAFLEFDVPEAALLAQESMNGQLMGGRNLKVGRPSNMPQAQPIIEMVQQDAKRYHRCYVFVYVLLAAPPALN